MEIWKEIIINLNMSQENKHTPGPHYALNYAGYIKLQSTPYYDGDPRKNGGDLLDADDVGMETAEANGRLYAAAPDLLNALEGLCEYWEWAIEDPDFKWYKEAKKAIKKAKGL